MAGKTIFNSVKVSAPGTNTFDLSHDVKLSCNMGQLVPTLCQEVVPGDRFTIGCDSMVRFAPLVAPIMHRVDVYMHYFFVPFRILWENWENFITNTEVAGNVPAAPYITLNASNWDALDDFFGIPQPIGPGNINLSAMFHAAYQCIYNEYYRDQNLVPEVDYTLTDGANLGSHLRTLRQRAWEHDYFTSALPFEQKGSAVELPLSAFPDVNVFSTSTTGGGFQTITSAPSNQTVAEQPSATFPTLVNSLYADTSSINPATATINDLRRAFRLQEWLEKNARGGTRYSENILAHFGVRSPDARLQRPEYITGTKSPIVISEVLNTGGDEATLPQGNMAGHGVGVTMGQYGSYRATEHGCIIGIMSTMPKTAYQQGVPKQFLKITDFTDHFWPSFAHLGEQEIKQIELYADPATADATFGYTPRYAEYKFNPNRVAGEFRTTLDYWHLGRIFNTAPGLNQTFIECNPSHRVFAVTDPTQDKLYCQVLHKIRAERPMPKYGTPTF